MSLRIADIQLKERAGQFLRLPGRGGFAGAEAHDHIADLERLAGPHCKVPRYPVALVQKTNHRHPLRHRRGAWRQGGDGLRNIHGLRLGVRLPVLPGRNRPAIACSQCTQAQEDGTDDRL